MQQLFDTCIEVTNPSLTISVSDLVYVFNSLVHHKDLICIKKFEEDPIRVLV